MAEKVAPTLHRADVSWPTGSLYRNKVNGTNNGTDDHTRQWAGPWPSELSEYFRDLRVGVPLPTRFPGGPILFHFGRLEIGDWERMKKIDPNRALECPRVEKVAMGSRPWRRSLADGFPTLKERGSMERTRRQMITHTPMGRPVGPASFRSTLGMFYDVLYISAALALSVV